MVGGCHSELERLSAEIAACRICRDAPLKGPADRLPHEPRPVATLSSRARILIAGQAPGLRVHESGIPFNDASGDRLRDWLDVSRETFYDIDRFAMLPMGFCFPGYDAKGGDLPPRRECAPIWRERAMRAMPQVELVLAVGQYAQAWHMREERRESLTETVRAWRQVLFANRSPAILPLPHPSWRNSGWIKRNPWFTEELLPVLRERIKLLTS
ncbi:uracil-DNA glycosylase family protein [Rhizobium grahamii]|uniref:Uracil-DNA glycosylase family protein n=1 Tax=Rhizobium grahamii TaxID=1120045 RepID=A0A5Q0C8N8_9HYPH|nr:MULTISPECIES: uracil-DNA glycosylase family protein [Rhizobium]QFY60317.1 uracil-DNA glycosylase family protein [Rhizobium grahamii]QRM50556.1 uracil-DNA glycosylase family protein [Rhizobium sp. BG6]